VPDEQQPLMDADETLIGFSPNLRAADTLKELGHESHESTRMNELVLFVQIRVIRGHIHAKLQQERAVHQR